MWREEHLLGCFGEDFTVEYLPDFRVDLPMWVEDTNYAGVPILILAPGSKSMDRMSRLIDSIRKRHAGKYGSHPQPRLSEPQITELLYDHDVATLRDQVTRHLKLKESVWILFDNLDKGWPTHGLEHEDVLILRALLEATRKLERHLDRNDIEAHTWCFSATTSTNSLGGKPRPR